MELLWWYREESCSSDIAAIDLAHHYYALARMSYEERKLALAAFIAAASSYPRAQPIGLDPVFLESVSTQFSKFHKVDRFGLDYLAAPFLDIYSLSALVPKAGITAIFSSEHSSLFDTGPFYTGAIRSLYQLWRFISMNLEPEAMTSMSVQMTSSYIAPQEEIYDIELKFMRTLARNLHLAMSFIGVLASLRGIDLWCCNDIALALCCYEEGRVMSMQYKVFNYIQNLILGMRYGEYL